jgi:hypothetical protein
MYDIKMNLQGIEWSDADWIQVADDRDKWWTVMNTVMNDLIR